MGISLHAPNVVVTCGAHPQRQGCARVSSEAEQVGSGDAMMGRWWGTGFDSGAGWLGLLLTALFAALVIAGLVVLVVWAVRTATGAGHQRYAMHGGYGPGHTGRVEREQGRYQATSGPDFIGPGPQGGGGSAATRSDDAVEIARRRFAAGEITREQYDEILNALNR